MLEQCVSSLTTSNNRNVEVKIEFATVSKVYFLVPGGYGVLACSGLLMAVWSPNCFGDVYNATMAYAGGISVAQLL